MEIEGTQLADISGPMQMQREVDRMLHGTNFRSVVPTSPHFRPGTELPVNRLNFIFSPAGMGDWICYMPAMIWTAKNCPWIYGRIFAAEYFNEFAKNIISQTDNHNWKVWPSERFAELVEPDTVMRGPGVKIKGRPANHQLVNGMGVPLVQLGFLYYCNLMIPDGWGGHPQIDWNIDHNIVHSKAPALPPPPYVCITPGGVADARMVPGQLWNPIIDHLKRKGLKVVFLGTTEIGKSAGFNGVSVTFPGGCNYDDEINLIDKTTMMEAAWIMKNAVCVIGLDNGLLQLAGCTDANVIALFNTVQPSHREPIRPSGKWLNVTLTQQELACIHCQTNWPNMFPHNFKRCLHHDADQAAGHVGEKCVDLLFANEGEKIKKAIDVIWSALNIGV